MIRLHIKVEILADGQLVSERSQSITLLDSAANTVSFEMDKLVEEKPEPKPEEPEPKEKEEKPKKLPDKITWEKDGSKMVLIPGGSFQMGDHLGTTRTWRGPDGVIIKAKVEILPAWGATERILEHEIGHALGWGDVRRTGHIMNSVWSLGGHGIEGLKK